MKKPSVYIYHPTIPPRVESLVDSGKGSKLAETFSRVSLVFWYLLACFRYRAVPWNYFQLNSKFFNKRKGIFSKIEMDQHIPRRWRLRQYYYDVDIQPVSFPVFLKPEWGQNSNGIVCVHNYRDYLKFRKLSKKTDMPFIVQSVAPGKKEFEIYYLRSPTSGDDCSFLSITQVRNRGKEKHPVNSIHNCDTEYIDTTKTFSPKELQTIWQYMRRIGDFRMARVGIKANNVKDMLQGNFHVVEVNLFLPLPLVLLAENVVEGEKKRVIKTTMTLAAQLVKSIPRQETGTGVFFRKMRAHYKTA